MMMVLIAVVVMMLMRAAVVQKLVVPRERSTVMVCFDSYVAQWMLKLVVMIRMRFKLFRMLTMTMTSAKSVPQDTNA